MTVDADGAEGKFVSLAEHSEVSSDGGRRVWKGPLDRLDEQVRRRSLAIAVIAGEEKLSYRDLDAAAWAFAARLQQQGVGPGDFVGLLMQRSAQAVVAMIGILRSGGAYVPMEVDSPSERVRLIALDARLALIAVDQATEQLVPAGLRTIVVNGMPNVEPSGPTSPAVEWKTQRDSAAYVIYTSGSTGHPKGVVVGHDNLAALLDASEPLLDLRSSDVWSCTHSFAFDFSVWEIWGALAFGGTVVIAHGDELRDPGRLVELLKVTGVTIFSRTPLAFELVAEPLRSACQASRLPLRLVIFGGDSLSWRKIARGAPRHGVMPTYVNMYGITECTVHVTAQVVECSRLHEIDENVIGQPIDAARCYVLDEHLLPTRPGVEGELYVGGPCVTRGYMSNPTETARRYVPDLFSAEAAGRMFRTGDFVLRDEQGLLRYVGRADRQIKVRGHRIERGEVEAAFLSDPRVQNAVALQSGDDLVLFVQSGVERDAATSRASLIARAATVLPPFMLPDRIVVLHNLPLTSNGKVDEASLLEVIRAESEQDAPAGQSESRSDLEKTVAGVWADVLGHTDFDAESRFGEVGGHSFAVVKMHQSLGGLGYDVPVTDIFRYPTVRTMALYLSQLQDGTAGAEAMSDSRQVRASAVAQGRSDLIARRKRASHS